MAHRTEWHAYGGVFAEAGDAPGASGCVMGSSSIQANRGPDVGGRMGCGGPASAAAGATWEGSGADARTGSGAVGGAGRAASGTAAGALAATAVGTGPLPGAEGASAGTFGAGAASLGAGPMPGMEAAGGRAGGGESSSRSRSTRMPPGPSWMLRICTV